jgi:hypothetical protein
VRFVGEMMLARNAQCWTVALTLESSSAFEPHPVVTLGLRAGPPVAVHLSWQHLEALVTLFTDAIRTYS